MRLRSLAPILCLALGLLGSGARAAQEQAPLSDPVQRELATVQELLARAQAEFDGPQQGRSIVLFDDIVGRLESLRRQGSLPGRGREILVQAYELRARAYYSIGLQEKAAESFRSLVQLAPQQSLSKERVSPKIVDFFNSVKKALVGYLAVSSRPAGAKVTLNGEVLGLTDFFPLEVLAGEYTVEVSREGYKTEQRQMSIAPKATETLQVDLVRTAASCFFITEPAGVEIWIDGTLRATTAGNLAPDLFDTARSKGIDPARASSRTEVANLSLGAHAVEFRRKCYEGVKRTIEVPEPQDYDTEPVRLEESLASLTLTSDPAGGQILVDGESMGQTPKQLDGLCSGRHRVEVKHRSGKWVKDVTLERNAALSLDCPIRPTLAFLGVVAANPSGERVVADVEERLLQNLQAIKSLNFVPAPRETVDRLLDQERLTRRSLLPGSGTDPELVRKLTEKLASALEVQGFLVAFLPEERLQRTASLFLLAAGNATPDRWDVAYAESAAYLRFVSALDTRAEVARPWSGLITIDTALQEGVPVLRLAPGSPAEKAGIQPGEVVYAADGKPIASTADLLALVAAKKPKERLALHLRGAAGATRNVDLTLDLSPREVPLNDSTLLYNKIMMELRQQIEGYPGTTEAAFARLNLAICAMHFGDFVAAHEHLLKAKGELPVRPGLSQGTALYYLGLALERLNYRREAQDAYKAAAGFKDATLFDNDGPAVAPLAVRRAGP
jgi:tetratricopeptide (TPR) repeat protein